MSTSSAQITELFQQVLDDYPVEKIGDGLTSNPVRGLLEEEIPGTLSQLLDGESLLYRGSAGQGRWTSIPWVAILDPDETEGTQEGVYVVYLFEPQEDRFYLTLNQGVTELKEDQGARSARQHLVDKAESIRQRVIPDEFTAGPLEFPHASSRNELYGAGTIYYKEYTSGTLPDDEPFLQTLEDLLEAYSEYLSRRESQDREGWEPSEETEYRARWLAERYREDRSWEDLRSTADYTSEAIRSTVEAVLDEYDGIDTTVLTALFRLCQHDGQINLDTKRDAVQKLAIPDETTEEILSYISKGTGSVGGPNFHLSVPDEATENALLQIFTTLLDGNDDELEEAVGQLADLDISGLQSGSFSPILHYLHPTKFPIINGLVVDGVRKYYGQTITKDLEDYLEIAESYRAIRDQYGFNSHFRDLDYFFVWADNIGERIEWDHDWTWMLTEDGRSRRDSYVIQPGSSGSDGGPDERPALWRAWKEHGLISAGGEDGDLRELGEEERKRRGKAHDWGATQAWETLMDMSPGDVIIAKWGSSKFVGLGVVKPDSYDYLPHGEGYQERDDGGTTSHPHIRYVDWVITDDDGWESDKIGLSTTFVRDTALSYSYFEELRYKFANHLQGDIDRFKNLERVSRSYFGESATQFRGGSAEGTRTILREEKETSRPAIPKGRLFEGLHFPFADDLLYSISAAIQAGKYIIFTGPPGTGKTELAENVAEILVEQEELRFTGYKLTTATADWTTFDTVGGRMPAETEDRLVFEPGFFLERFKKDGEQRNDILIIDELNRSDIDKAFGQLFTVLSGQAVQLPFKYRGETIEIVPEAKFKGNTPADHQFVVPHNWRLFATMNSYDKASLYEMSYAFMRRLAFIEVRIPDLKSLDAKNDPVKFLLPYLAEWYDYDTADIGPEAVEADPNLPGIDDVNAVVQVWYTLTVGEHIRPVGPALVRDMIEYMDVHQGPLEKRLADAVVAYVYPQLEGVPDAKEIVNELSELADLRPEADRMRSTAETMLDVSFGANTGDSLLDPN